MKSPSTRPRRLPIITLDGPAGAGKTTTARELATRLGFLHLDTGAMYRAIALKVLRVGCSLDQPDQIARIAKTAQVSLEHKKGAQRVFLDGEDVTAEVRSPEVTRAVTPVCEVSAVRDLMVDLQRRLGARGGVVVEGRDIGTVVFPDAELKIFLVADLPERARRRQKDLQAADIKADLDDLMRDIEQRDQRDQQRAHSPLQRAPDAILIDTTHLTFEEQVESILHHYSLLSTLSMRLDYRLICLLIRNFARLFFGLSIQGVENVPGQGRLLIAANHQSYLDPPLVGSCIPREIFYLAKVELFRKPLLGPLIRHLNSIPINRAGQDLESLRRAAQVLQNDGALLIFPEGTRSRTGQFLKPTRGLGFLAKQADAPVLPVYVHGTRGCWKRIFRRHAIKVVFGEPLQISSFNVEHQSASQAYQSIADRVMQEIAALQAAHT